MYKRLHYLLAALLATLGSQTFGEALSLHKNQLSDSGSFHSQLTGSAIQLNSDDAQGDSWLLVKPPEGKEFWDFSSFKTLAMDIENKSAEKQIRLVLQISSGSKADRNYREIFTGIALNPGEQGTIRLNLPHLWQHPVPKGVPGVKTIDTAKLNALKFFIQWPFERKQSDILNCQLSNLRVEGPLSPVYKEPSADYLPFIDIYGQYIHGNWPEKIHSPEDLRKAHAKELAELAASRAPTEWNQYGGWKNGPQLKATGSFRVEKYQNKWFLVDPEGKLFFSTGVDVLYPSTDAMKVEGHEKWFAGISAKTSYQPVDHNLRIKYGKDDFSADFYNTLFKRLNHWGMNTIGNWGNRDLIRNSKIPYVLQLTDHDSKVASYASNPKLKFYDVFDQRYVDRMTNLIQDRAKSDPLYLKSTTDPLCIGYFIDNELNFGNRNGIKLIDDILKCPPQQAAKRELISDMKAKYFAIEALNDAWKTNYKSWDAMLSETSVPSSAQYKADSKVFFRKTVERYFSICRDSVKSVAPNRLYLGCRFIGTDSVNSDLYEICQKYADVLSVNFYYHSVANYPVDNFPDMPVIIGEFHFGQYDRGMFHPGLATTGTTQSDRALAYTRFMQGVLIHPNFIGAHWFQFRDQPLIGRWDGEGYQIGFVDVTDTPYTELCRAARIVGENMYQYRLKGKLSNSMSD